MLIGPVELFVSRIKMKSRDQQVSNQAIKEIQCLKK